VEAFIQAFGKVDPNVMLVIKFSNSEHYPQQRDQFKALVADCPSIHLIEGHLMKEEVNALIYNCDCYVSLHRAEGFGLTMAEAMYYGKPVIATGYSANLEFMNVGNSFLVKYDLISTSADEGPYKKGNFWANPDVEHASALMHYIFHNYSQAQQIGIRAAREVRPLLSPPRIGDRIRNRLNYILDKQISTESKEHLPVKNSTTELQLQAWKRTAQQLQLELVKMQSGASNS
jgi:glycosyltransferase involved in cell wall biosynthesis